MDYPHENQDNDGSLIPKGKNAALPPPPPTDMPAPPTHLQINFKDTRGTEQAFKLKSTTSITKAMDAFSAKVERPRAALRFLFEGERMIRGTVAENGLEDGDTVEVYEEQFGGGDGCCGGKCHCGDKNCDGKCCSGTGGCGGGKGK